MAWIESHQEVGTHPKTRKLARLLDVPIPQAVGHMHMIWHWALSFAQDGSLSKFDADDIAVGAMWDGDADTFLKALIDARYVDETEDGRVLHNWHKYAGRLIEKRRKDAERKAAARGQTQDPPPPPADQAPEVQSPSVGHPEDGAGNRTEPDLDLTKPETLTRPADALADFEKFWDRYPKRNGKRIGKAKALKVWSRLTTDQRDLVSEGVRHYAAACDKGLTIAKDAFRWLRDGEYEEWLDPAQAPRKPGEPSAPYLAEAWGTSPPEDEPSCEHSTPICADCRHANIVRFRELVASGGRSA